MFGALGLGHHAEQSAGGRELTAIVSTHGEQRTDVSVNLHVVHCVQSVGYHVADRSVAQSIVGYSREEISSVFEIVGPVSYPNAFSAMSS